MPCYKPIPAYRGRVLPSGKRSIVFQRKEAVFLGNDFHLPCGSCVGCRLERARQWAMRCVDESSLYKDNCFVTLTFNDANLPLNRSLDVRHFQLFMKRLRKHAGDHMIRYFHCGEYGPKHGRPHYHSLLFNWDFSDRSFLKVCPSGEKIYTSKTLGALWPFGYSSVGNLTFGSAAYVARYALKKVGSVVSDNHYVNKISGECLAPEYVTMSRGCKSRGTGGIARGWFDKFSSDVFPHDSRVIKGVDTKPAKFYDSLYEASDPAGFEKVKLARMGRVDLKDNTWVRLAVKEEVKLAQIRSLSCSLED